MQALCKSWKNFLLTSCVFFMTSFLNFDWLLWLLVCTSFLILTDFFDWYTIQKKKGMNGQIPLPYHTNTPIVHSPFSSIMLTYLSCYFQHVESGCPGDGPVCPYNAGPVPQAVCHPGGFAERPVLPYSHGGTRGWVRLQHWSRPVHLHSRGQPATRTSVSLQRAWWQREVAPEVFQPHLPVQRKLQRLQLWPVSSRADWTKLRPEDLRG